MKFGVREIANVVFRAKGAKRIGGIDFADKQPVLYIDSAKTSTLEGAATTVYAQGGRGNSRLISWQGEKTLTFTVEQALLSPTSFAMLSGAGLLKGANDSKVHFHQTTFATIDATNHQIDLTDALEPNEEICSTAPIYVLAVDEGGDLTGVSYTGTPKAAQGETLKKVIDLGQSSTATGSVMVDYYVMKNAANVHELQIDVGHFAGYYYVEADTLFRRQSDGKDLPANLTLPNVKIQSNFTFSMASTGDPSTFSFTMDALPGYTYFNGSKKVLCAIQIVDDAASREDSWSSVFPHSQTL